MAGRATRPRLALSIGATLRAANDDWDGNDRTGGTELTDFDSFLDSLFIAASKGGGGRETREETNLFIGTINYKTLARAARPVIAEIISKFSTTVLHCS